MAFVQTINGDGLVRDTWPSELGRLCMDDKEYPDMESSDVVPSDAEDVWNWAVVALIPKDSSRPIDPTRRWSIVHNRESAPVAMRACAVTLRIQGLLGRHNFNVMGNWDRMALAEQ
ncbi:hypothetical protein FA95DRAFT_1607558 [Auriscalpium vulgare]|uniref:Uncharacterized protein n=1 Tax=Auriscalpium vulgare TaxID=40419 RepID=A0ACB8RPW6_9AGAM|nr:hypothetical protein FA95DRAFT_1607558 [Auriscalpium vulgare]